MPPKKKPAGPFLFRREAGAELSPARVRAFWLWNAQIGRAHV